MTVVASSCPGLARLGECWADNDRAGDNGDRGTSSGLRGQDTTDKVPCARARFAATLILAGEFSVFFGRTALERHTLLAGLGDDGICSAVGVIASAKFLLSPRANRADGGGGVRAGVAISGGVRAGVAISGYSAFNSCICLSTSFNSSSMDAGDGRERGKKSIVGSLSRVCGFCA